MVTKLFAFASLLFMSSGPDLGRLTWGLGNLGDPQQILIDHYTSGIIEGVAGEDIHPLDTAETVNRRSRRTVIVAVLDTGIDEGHPAFAGALLKPGYNAILDSNDIKDTHGHGTHVSGIIAARGTPNGFRGVSQSAQILPIRVIQTGPNAPIRPQGMDSSSEASGAGTALTENVAKGIVHAIERGAEIIHLSLAWPASIRSSRVDAAMELARKKGVLVVASSGNDSTEARVYPCIYSNVICVGAHGPDGAITHFSNHGPMVDLLAPGISILSAWPLSKNPITFAGQVGYEFRNGTSMAAPFVSGALAEMLALGFPADEAVNRILVATRTLRTKSKFRSELVGTPPPNEDSRAPKESRFGNLDLARAVAIRPEPLILPEQKEAIRIEWDGSETSHRIEIPWTNRWMAASNVIIRVENQEFRFKNIGRQETVRTSLEIPIGFMTESSLELRAEVEVPGFSRRKFGIPVSLVRRVDADSRMNGLSIQHIEGFKPDSTMSIRSVVASGKSLHQEYVFLKDTPSALELSLISPDRLPRATQFQKMDSSRLLNFYFLPDGSYRAIFTVQDPGNPRPSFLWVHLDSDLKKLAEFRLGTELTVLSEKFRFVLFKGEYSPHWVSLGFTPKEDLPPYDPWNPDFKDLKSPKLFYLDHDQLRMIAMPKGHTPLYLLEGSRVLSTQGSGYGQNYFIHDFEDGKIIRSSPLESGHYRMLLGLETTPESISLSGAQDSRLRLSGRSSPGSLRVSAPESLDPRDDTLLARPSSLDSLMGVLGVYLREGSPSYFVESHYDLHFFPARNANPFSTSLNRYSYIPSMIFSKSFFPVPVSEGRAKGTIASSSLPGLYLPASEANGFISEIWIADEEHRKILKPLGLRLEAKPPCQAIGNPVPANGNQPAQIMFWCGQRLVGVPLTIRE